MTPTTYFDILYPEACGAARAFCMGFETMRDAWLSPKVDVGHMLWAIGRHEDNKPALLSFAQWCARRARRRTNAPGRTSSAGAEFATCATDSYQTAKEAWDTDECSLTVADAALDTAHAVNGAAWNDADGGPEPKAYAAECKLQRKKLREMFPEMFVEAPAEPVRKRRPKPKGRP